MLHIDGDYSTRSLGNNNNNISALVRDPQQTQYYDCDRYDYYFYHYYCVRWRCYDSRRELKRSVRRFQLAQSIARPRPEPVRAPTKNQTRFDDFWSSHKSQFNTFISLQKPLCPQDWYRKAGVFRRVYGLVWWV